MNIIDTIFDRIDSFRNEMIDMQIKLCSLPAISPSSGGEGEIKKAEVLLEFLKKNGFSDVDLIKRIFSLSIKERVQQKPSG